MMRKHSTIHRIISLTMLAAMLTPALTLSANAQAMTKNTTMTKAKPLTEDQKITHVLNRLGYGIRAGDVER